jgi:hypothetical protein
VPNFYPEGNVSLPSDDAMRSLHKLVSLGGGTGAGGIGAIYEGRDPAAPDDPTQAAISFPTGGGPMTEWSVSLQAWV